MCVTKGAQTEELLNNIIAWMVENGTTETSNGGWIIYYCDIVEQFPEVNVEWLGLHHQELHDILEVHPSVAEVISEKEDDSTEGNFDMMFNLNDCKDWDGTLEWGCL